MTFFLSVYRGTVHPNNVRHMYAYVRAVESTEYTYLYGFSDDNQQEKHQPQQNKQPR